jgi:hypothetical protein
MLKVNHLHLDQWLSTWVAVKFAQSCIHLWEASYPEDHRPALAIAALEAWLNDSCEQTINEVRGWGYAASAAADEANMAHMRNRNASPSRQTTYAAANLACEIGFIASYSISKDSSATYSNTNASAIAAAACWILGTNGESYVHSLLKKHLTFIIDYKIRHNQGFGCLGEVFKAATEADKEKLLFHLEKDANR